MICLILLLRVWIRGRLNDFLQQFPLVPSHHVIQIVLYDLDNFD